MGRRLTSALVIRCIGRILIIEPTLYLTNLASGAGADQKWLLSKARKIGVVNVCFVFML